MRISKTQGLRGLGFRGLGNRFRIVRAFRLGFRALGLGSGSVKDLGPSC